MTSSAATPATGTFSFLPSISGLPAYVPGSSGAGEQVYKLSSNEVPHPPAPAVVEAVTEVAARANRYPQMRGDDLCTALAHHHGLDPQRVLVGNGSVSLLELILRSAAGPGDEVVYSWRSFEAYPILVQTAGATSVQVPNTLSGHHDLDAMLAAITDRTKVVIVCTPNNPTGQAASHAEVAAFIDAVPKRVLVLLDEAYVHFDRSEEPVDSRALLTGGDDQERQNLIVLRTFSKAYGLAGLRVGYGLGPGLLIGQLRTASTPFGLNEAGARAGLAALASADYTDGVVAEIVDERTRIVRALREQGWEVGEPQGNFYWLPIGGLAHEFAAEALAAGFTARPFPEGVRITIGEPAANDLALGLTATWAQKLLKPQKLLKH